MSNDPRVDEAVADVEQYKVRYPEHAIGAADAVSIFRACMADPHPILKELKIIADRDCGHCAISIRMLIDEYQ